MTGIQRKFKKVKWYEKNEKRRKGKQNGKSNIKDRKRGQKRRKLNVFTNEWETIRGYG